MLVGNYLRLDEYYIFYCIVGKGSHVVLFIDDSVSHCMFGNNFQIENYDLEKFTIVLWDPPGLGKSRPPEKDFSINDHFINAEYAFRLMKALKFNMYSVWGKCSGGAASMILAAKHPEEVKALVLSNTRSHYLQTDLENMKKTRQMDAWSPKILLGRIDVYGLELFAKMWTNWVANIEKIVEERNGNICSHLLKDIKCPTLILGGGKDPIVDNCHARYLNENIKESQLYVGPEWGHFPYVKMAVAFSRIVQDFLLQH